VFEDVASATEALKRMQDFPFYDKPMVSLQLKPHLYCCSLYHTDGFGKAYDSFLCNCGLLGITLNGDGQWYT
jgi:hypothetical protein